MGKGDNKPYWLELQLHPGVFAVIDILPPNDVYYTNSDGFVRISYPKNATRHFTITADGFQQSQFDYKFTVPLTKMEVLLKPVQPEPPPVDDNVLYTDIDSRYGAIDKKLFQNAILIQNRTIKYTWGDVDKVETNLASVVRSWVNLIWGCYAKENGFDVLDEWVNDLPSSTAKTVNSNMALRNLCSYTTPHEWVYSGGKDSDGKARWPKQFQIIEQLYGMPASAVIKEKIFDKLTGSYSAWMVSDGTMRISSSVRDLYKLARLLFNNGKWNNEVVITEQYAQRSIAGGAKGDNIPYYLEGYQTHLIKNESAWEMEGKLPGVPDGFMARSEKSYIIGIPSLELIMCGHGPAQLQSAFLPQVCQIMRMQ